MRRILVAGVFVFAAMAQMGGTAQAREYPWCARYDWTTSNCGFVSLNQCLATVSGIGGRCEPNPRFAYGEPRRKRIPRY